MLFEYFTFRTAYVANQVELYMKSKHDPEKKQIVQKLIAWTQSNSLNLVQIGFYGLAKLQDAQFSEHNDNDPIY